MTLVRNSCKFIKPNFLIAVVKFDICCKMSPTDHVAWNHKLFWVLRTQLFDRATSQYERDKRFD